MDLARRRRRWRLLTNTAKGASLSGNSARFDDFVSPGSGGGWWSYQSFTASSAGSAARPLMVIDGNNMWTTLGIHATSTRININGNDGPRENGKLRECDTPDL